MSVFHKKKNFTCVSIVFLICTIFLEMRRFLLKAPIVFIYLRHKPISLIQYKFDYLTWYQLVVILSGS